MFERGATLLEARGAYSDTKRTVIYFVVNRFQIGKLRSLVRGIDPNAYITVTEVADVFRGGKRKAA